MANQSCIALACHYMTQHFTIKAFTLACNHLPESHTAANIKTSLIKITAKWSLGLSNMPVYVVTDNGSIIRAAVLQMELNSLQCFGHTFQLAVRDAKKETPAVSLLCNKA